MTDPGFRARSTIRYTGVLRSNGPGTWTLLELDAATSSRLGARGKVRVRVGLSGRRFETTAVPNGDGTHSLLITKPIQAAVGVAPGQRVTVTMTRLTGPRTVKRPQELVRALRTSSRARARFGALAPSHQRAWAEYVDGAKEGPTRQRRAARAVERILGGVPSPKE